MDIRWSMYMRVPRIKPSQPLALKPLSIINGIISSSCCTA
jgi:hypothetical protein